MRKLARILLVIVLLLLSIASGVSGLVLMCSYNPVLIITGVVVFTLTFAFLYLALVAGTRSIISNKDNEDYDTNSYH